jgi:hypothetical protein
VDAKVPPLIQAVHDSGMGGFMRDSLWSMPVIEALHVLAIATVFGTVLIVDLRLLGLMGTRRAFTRTANELLKWTWVAFAVAAATGVMMFTANALSYYVNAMFRWKLVLMALAGLNMAVFHVRTLRTVASWDTVVPPPRAARLAGVVSLVIWLVVVALGRGIGFTKGYNFEIPEDAQIQMEFPQ